ncbi:MAG: sugar MFS transporter [Bacteroidales bacterium]|nr:sugar MFS transporter [Bacteroidales bacterium]
MQNTKNLTFSMSVIGALFFVFGFVTWLNSILMPYLELTCNLNKFQASFVPFAFYIAYFVTAIPSSLVLKKTGFSNGMALGLIIMAIGAVLFIPAAMSRTYIVFLLALFIMGIGLSLLQTASNPYVTVLGPVESAARRMSIMGICNKLAGIIGVLILANTLFSTTDGLVEQIKAMDMADPGREVLLQQLSNKVIVPYLIITATLIALVVFVKIAKLPEIQDEEEVSEGDTSRKSIFSYPYLWLGVLAIFFYVGAEVIAIDYLKTYGNSLGLPENVTNMLPAYALVALIVGYLLSIITVPKMLSQRMALIIQLLLAIVLVVVALCTSGIVSVIAIICLSFAHAIMWPAIWPLSIHDLGKYTKLGSAFLIMAIAGGAILPLIYGKMSLAFNPQIAYSLLFVCYAYILFFATVGCKYGTEK